MATPTRMAKKAVGWDKSHRTRSIQPKFPEISVQNSMDRFGPTGKVSKKRVHLLRWTTFPGRTGWNFGWMDRAHNLGLDWQNYNFARVARFCVHFFAVVARPQRETSYFHVLWRTWRHMTTIFSFFFRTSIHSFRIQLQNNSPLFAELNEME